MAGVFFNGQKLVSPTTASAVNDDAMQPQNLSVGNALAIIGKATGGTPKQVLKFGTPEEAEKVLRSGELLEAVKRSFAPSDDTGAPQTIFAVRVNPAVQASLVLKDAQGNAAITLASANFGQADNLNKVKIENGSVSGKAISVAYGSNYLYQDNIGRAALSVLYTGAEATATISVAADKVTLKAGADVQVILLADFSTVSSLADKINSLGTYTATVLDNSDNQPTANALDYANEISVKTLFTVRADLQAVVDFFNDYAGDMVVATRGASAGSVPVNVPYTFLAGGSDGNTTVADWTAGLTALRGKDVQWVVPMSGDAGIHALVDTHCLFCSTTLRKERRSIVGTELGTSDVQAKAAAKALNSKRTSVVHIGCWDYNAANKLTLYPAYMTAVLIAAGFAGSNPGTPMTNKTLRVRGLERDLLNPTDTDDLLLAGVLPVENTATGYKVVQSITSWLGDSKYNNREQSCGVALDYTVRSVRDALDPLRGQKNNPILMSRAASIAKTALTELAKEEPAGVGVLAGDEANPPFRNITAVVQGDVIGVQFECSPVIPANYILVTVYARPYSGSTTA